MDTNLLMLVKILLAVVLGGIVGYERERSGSYAGIRTHILVCMTSTFLIGAFISYEGFEFDSVARVCAAIMTGIGFLGAGTIMSRGGEVKGLTTAASVWGVAALGMVVAIGSFWEALVVTIIMVFVLEMTFFTVIKRRI